MEDIWEMISGYEEKMKSNGFFEANRADQRLNWMHEHIRFLLETKFYQNPLIKGSIEAAKTGIQEGTTSAIAKARELVDLFIKKVNDE
ncbi:arginine/ornithine transport system ATPase [Indibacter alkaliphilus LW1]|uniref:Arginine/ornithine transport system ATPase n=1 Tax=Indibacter alkaliphilus (strain CCUG 57479 / KCTC 22604 / LW1) TaxID=1189612 RepID=S2D849_INDAL|nr:arginine/ornithine transport system ATPase [Indibacter alkaliphilus LW1]